MTRRGMMVGTLGLVGLVVVVAVGGGGGDAHELARTRTTTLTTRTTGFVFGRTTNAHQRQRRVHIRQEPSRITLEEGGIRTSGLLKKRFAATAENDSPGNVDDLTEEDWNVVRQLDQQLSASPSSAEATLLPFLSQASPRLLTRLRDAAADDKDSVLARVGKAVSTVMDESLRTGRDLLQELMDSGELRKLDAAIGKAAKEGRLDVAFFTVLNRNLQQAAADANNDAASPPTPQTLSSEPPNKMQILQHIYTRCQEEVEKLVDPAMALLHKLWRTEEVSIRSNLLHHYLAPAAPTTLVAPDGSEVQLESSGESRISSSDFVQAVTTAVCQIRTATSSSSSSSSSVDTAAAQLIEQCRQVAMEARLVLVEAHGAESPVVAQFQRELQPVFRPPSVGTPQP